MENERRDIMTIDASAAAAMLPKREADCSKADCGNVLILAGASGMTGAAAMASFAALRSGAGLVRVGTPRRNFRVLQVLVPEAICVGPEEALRALSRYDAVAIGPGMGVSGRTERLLTRVIRDFGGPLVIDADGLNTLAARALPRKALSHRAAPTILTPHMGEAKRLLGALEKTREETALALADRYGAYALLKGQHTLIACPDGRLYRNTSGCSGMATGGSGDVLTGVITALLGQGAAPAEAAAAGCYIHGLAGELAQERMSCYGMTARDIIRKLPGAFVKVTREEI